MDELEQEFVKILRALEECGALQQVALIGSWAMFVYSKTMLFGKISTSRFKTRDLDFSLHSQKGPYSSNPPIGSKLRSLDYVSRPKGFDEAEEFVAAAHSNNELSIEFLASRTKSDKPFWIPKMEVTACPLRFQDVLLNKLITVNYQGLEINVPDPVIWAMHKIAISQLRQGRNHEDKMENDIMGANVVIEAVGEDLVLQAVENEMKKFKNIFKRGWKMRNEISEGKF